MNQEKIEAVEQTQSDGFQESSLLGEIVNETMLKPGSDGFNIAKKGVETLIAELVSPTKQIHNISTALVDDMIAEIDQTISAQLDEIMHAAEFKKLESSWRSLKYLVDQTNFRENVRIDLINASKEDLQDDFQEASEICKSGLYKTAYTAEYGQFGGKPYSSIISNYDFGPGPQDMKLLQALASVSAMSHAPMIAAAGPQFFGVDSFSDLPNLKDLKTIFEGPQYIKWNSFRESEDARYIGLTLPRFSLRLPYEQNSPEVKNFVYKENVSGSHEDYLWGNAAFAFATRLTDSFAKYRWCSNIIGPTGGGAVEDLPLHQYESMGSLQTKIPTEVLISERREFELADEGFIGLTMRKGSDNAAFFSANSAQKPKYFGESSEGKEKQRNYTLGTQLPYIYIVNRLAHYLKVIQRENIGAWKDRNDLQRELDEWIRPYISDQEGASASVRSRRPLRKAKITVSDVEGEPGWYKVGLGITPHFKYMGASFTLSLVGKLDKK